MNTERLQIRPTNSADFHFLFRLQSDPVVMRFIRPPATDPEQVRQRMDAHLKYGEENPGLGGFVAESIDKQELIGNAVLRHVGLEPGNDLEVGYSLAPEFWGLGYATEITQALVRYAREVFSAEKVVAFTDPENQASNHVLEKCGFRSFGVRPTPDGEGLHWEVEFK